MRLRFQPAACIVFLLAVTACSPTSDSSKHTATIVTAAPVSAEQPTGAELGPYCLLFCGRRGENYDIYRIYPDGRGLQRLTTDPEYDFIPRYSVAADRLTFVSYRSGNWDSYSINLDGTDLLRLTDSPDLDSAPTWSLDGTLLYYSSTTRLYERHNFVMNADGSNKRALTNSEVAVETGAVSPDGKYLLSKVDDSISIQRVDGSDSPVLVAAPFVIGPNWSPNGKMIAFSAIYDENRSIYTMRADGTKLARLTNDGTYDDSHAWSPDGNSIAFVSFDDGRDRLCAVGLDGRISLRTERIGGVWRPAWSPDGRHIACATDSRDGFNLTVVDVKTGAIHHVETGLDFGPLARAPGPPCWVPAPSAE